MVLDTEALKYCSGSIVAMDGARNCDSALWKKEPLAFILRDLQVIGNLLKLAARHLKCWSRIEGRHSHDSPLTLPARNLGDGKTLPIITSV